MRNTQNQLVFNQNGITVDVQVVKTSDLSVIQYREIHNGLSTNANGLLTLMVGSKTAITGNWDDIVWDDASIVTVISYDPGSGTVTITSDPAPVSAVPFALQAGNMSNITNIIGDAIHDSIVNNIENNISEQIHDSIVYNIENTISSQIHDSIVDALSDYQIKNCDDVNDCVATAIADGNSVINHAIDTVVANNIGGAIHDSIVNNISEQIHDSIVNNIENNISGQIHDSIVDALSDYQIKNCDDVNKCVTTAIADGNSELNHAIDTVVLNNIGGAIHDSIVNNIENNISEQIHDSIVDALSDYQIKNCDDVNDCVATAIADGNSVINHAIDTVVANNIGGAIHDSIVNNISTQIHDSIVNNIENNISEQIHDSIVYNIENTISTQIHDSISNYLTASDYVTESNLCTTIETNCTNVALRDGNTFTGKHDFTGADSVTVPNAINPDLATALASTCTQEAVNLCDLLAVFDSLNRRINELDDELTALKNAINLPSKDAPTLMNITATSMTIKANNTSTGSPITSYNYCYSVNADMSGAICQTSPNATLDVTGLTPYTVYYATVEATNSTGSTVSDKASDRTLAHAPSANVTQPIPTTTTSFTVEVTDIDPKEKDDATTVQVCYKQSSTCPEQTDYSDYTCAVEQSVAAGVTTNTQDITGLTPSTDYCVIVKVSNGDSTTVKGPYAVTTDALVLPGDEAPTLQNITATSMTIKANNTSAGSPITSYNYCYSVNADMSGAICQTSTEATLDVTGLTPYTIYYATVEATNADGSTVSQQASDRTLAHAPSANVTTPIPTTTTSFTVEVTDIDPKEKDDATTVQVCHVAKGTGECPDKESSDYVCGTAQSVATGVTTNTQTITGLTPSTEYCVIVKVSNGDSTTVKGPYTATTATPILPGDEAPTLTNITATTMTIEANNSTTGSPISSYRYCYSVNADMSSATCQTSTSSSLNVTGLTPNTVYYATVEATNDAGSTLSEKASDRTLAHAPSANVTQPFTVTPTSISVEVTDIDPKEKDDATTVQVCYKQSASCAAQSYYNDYTCATEQSVAAGVTTNTQDITGLTPSTNYCVIVKVSNGDSTTIKGPYSVSTTNVSMSLVSTGGGNVNLCGATNVDVVCTANIVNSNASEYTYSWTSGSISTSANTATYRFSSAGTYPVTVTATHTGGDYTLTASSTITVGSGGTAATLSICEDEDGLGKVTVSSTNCTSLSWVRNATGTEVCTSLTELAVSSTCPVGSYTVTGVNNDGCSITKTVTLRQSVITPCSSTSWGSYTPRTTANGYTPTYGTDGVETVDANGHIVSVKDIQGNEYQVVQIGSQCWMAVNMRTTKYADNTDLIFEANTTTSTAYPRYFDNTGSSYPLERRGYLYNWRAAMNGTSPSTTQGICPTGWHVPNDTQWNTLERTVSGSTWQSSYETSSNYRGSHAGKLSTGCKWSSSTTANSPGNLNQERNTSGFSAIPVGYKFPGYDINNSTQSIYFWSSTKFDSSGSNRWGRRLKYDEAGVLRSYYTESNAYSVRCLRNQ